jgi:hypothetical protein
MLYRYSSQISIDSVYQYDAETMKLPDGRWLVGREVLDQATLDEYFKPVDEHDPRLELVPLGPIPGKQDGDRPTHV